MDWTKMMFHVIGLLEMAEITIFRILQTNYLYRNNETHYKSAHNPSLKSINIYNPFAI